MLDKIVNMQHIVHIDQTYFSKKKSYFINSKTRIQITESGKMQILNQF